MVKLEWLQTARADLVSIVNYIADDNPYAAQQLVDDIQNKATMLSEYPNMGRVGRVKGTRELVITSNYVIIYQESDVSVRILRVLHTAQQWPLVQ